MPTFDPTNLEGRDRLSHVEEYLQSPKTDSLIRAQIVTQGRGLIAESMHMPAATGSVALPASLANSSAIGLRKGDVITNIVALIVTAQAPGIFQGGLHDKNGIHLGHTASLGASITGSAYWIAPLVTPVTIATDDLYMVGVTSQGAATQPTLSRGIGQAGSGRTAALGGGQIFSHAATAGAADMTGNLTFVGANSHFWFGVS